MWWHNNVFTAVVRLHCYLEASLSRRSLLMSVGDKNSLALQVLVVFMWRETCCPHAAVPFEETVNREWCDASCEKCIQYISTARPYMNRSSSRIYEKKRQCTDSGRWRCVFIIHPVFTGTPNSMLCSLHHSRWLHWKTILQIWLLLHWVLEEQ